MQMQSRYSVLVTKENKNNLITLLCTSLTYVFKMLLIGSFWILDRRMSGISTFINFNLVTSAL